MTSCPWCGASVTLGDTAIYSCDCKERIECANAGEPMHRACGWCESHRGPRFQCLGDPDTCDTVKAYGRAAKVMFMATPGDE